MFIRNCLVINIIENKLKIKHLKIKNINYYQH